MNPISHRAANAQLAAALDTLPIAQSGQFNLVPTILPQSEANLAIELTTPVKAPQLDTPLIADPEAKLHHYQLVAEACDCPPHSIQRQKSFTKLIRAIGKSGKLWQENTPYYPDALQQTWLYLHRNLCEANTGQKYNPALGSVTTWLNAYLKRRLQDFYKEVQDQKARTAFEQLSESGERLNSVDNLPSPPDIPNILEETRAWVEADINGELRRLHMQDHPEVTCQVLILRRLPPETPWRTLAVEFDLSISTLSNFYRRQCLPRLRKFGELQGYL